MALWSGVYITRVYRSSSGNLFLYRRAETGDAPRRETNPRFLSRCFYRGNRRDQYIRVTQCRRWRDHEAQEKRTIPDPYVSKTRK